MFSLTGATGFIGSMIVRDLLGKGHEVVGLARSDESATTLRDQGVEVSARRTRRSRGSGGSSESQ